MSEALKGIDFSNPASFKAAAIAALVMAALWAGKIVVKLLFMGLKAAAKKTPTAIDDEIVAAAEADLEKK